MSDAPSGPYRIDHGANVPKQIRAIKATAKKKDRLGTFIDLMKEGLRRLETDPHGFGDPEFRSKQVDAVTCHALLRPLMLRYVIYEQEHGVVLLSIMLYADFD
jgi:hypothetical protein